MQIIHLEPSDERLEYFRTSVCVSSSVTIMSEDQIQKDPTGMMKMSCFSIERLLAPNVNKAYQREFNGFDKTNRHYENYIDQRSLVISSRQRRHKDFNRAGLFGLEHSRNGFRSWRIDLFHLS